MKLKDLLSSTALFQKVGIRITKGDNVIHIIDPDYPDLLYEKLPDHLLNTNVVFLQSITYRGNNEVGDHGLLAFARMEE